MVKKLHVVQSGPKAGSFVECRAEKQCRVGVKHVEYWNLANASHYFYEHSKERVNPRDVTAEKYNEYFTAAGERDAEVATDEMTYVQLSAEYFGYLESIRQNNEENLTVTYSDVTLHTSTFDSANKTYGLSTMQVTGPRGKIKLLLDNVRSWGKTSEEDRNKRFIKTTIVLDKKDYDTIVEVEKNVFGDNPRITSGARGFMNRIETVTINTVLKEYSSSHRAIVKLVENHEQTSSFDIVERENFIISKPDFPVTDNPEIVARYKETLSSLRSTRSALLKANGDEELQSKDHHYVDRMISSYLPEAAVLFNEMHSKAETVQQKKDMESKLLEILTVVERKANVIKEQVSVSDRRFDAHLDFMKDLSV